MQEFAVLRWGELYGIPIAVLIVTVIAVTLPQPLTMVSLSARAETLQVDVSNPEESSIALPRARLGDRGTCLRDVVLRPERGATVYYTRPIAGRLVVAIKNGSSWRTDQSLLGRTSGVSQFIIDPNDAGCRIAGTLRLPIAGRLTVGTMVPARAAGERAMPVLNGDIKVYGRAVRSILGGILPLTWLEYLTDARPGTLYLAETEALPAGSHIGRAFIGAPGRSEEARWWGFADTDVSGASPPERGFIIEASTNAATLEVTAPAPSQSRDFPADRPDVISLTLAARLVGDPNLRWLFAIITFVIFVIGVEAQLISIPPPRRGGTKQTTPAPASDAGLQPVPAGQFDALQP